MSLIVYIIFFYSLALEYLEELWNKRHHKFPTLILGNDQGGNRGHPYEREVDRRSSLPPVTQQYGNISNQKKNNLVLSHGIEYENLLFVFY